MPALRTMAVCRVLPRSAVARPVQPPCLCSPLDPQVCELGPRLRGNTILRRQLSVNWKTAERVGRGGFHMPAFFSSPTISWGFYHACEAVPCDRMLTPATKPGRKAYHCRFHPGAASDRGRSQAEHGNSVSLAGICRRTADAGPISTLSLASSRDSPRSYPFAIRAPRFLCSLPHHFPSNGWTMDSGLVSGQRHGGSPAFSRPGAMPSLATSANFLAEKPGLDREGAGIAGGQESTG